MAVPLYRWTDVVANEELYARMKQLYDGQCSSDGVVYFPFFIRDALANQMCATTNDLQKAPPPTTLVVDEDQMGTEMNRHLDYMQVTYEASNPTLWQNVCAWGNQVQSAVQLVYEEMRLKLQKEHEILIAHFSLHPPAPAAVPVNFRGWKGVTQATELTDDSGGGDDDELMVYPTTAPPSTEAISSSSLTFGGEEIEVKLPPPPPPEPTAAPAPPPTTASKKKKPAGRR